jgi:hypothetical protein
MSDCAPHLDVHLQFGDLDMLVKVAQWSHNTLLLAMALLTFALVLFAI